MADWRCEACDRQTGGLEGHHLHYDTLGFEEVDDIRALCRQCHEDEHDTDFEDEGWR